MKFSKLGFVKGIISSLLICAIVYGGLRAFGVVGDSGDSGMPADIARTATESLEAVRNRQPGDRRPASYDSVLQPLDALLRQARELQQSDVYDPVNDFEKMRSLVLPVMDIATRADSQARSETAYLTKEYRFNEQKGEAAQYLAAAMWERMNIRRRSDAASPLNQSESYPQGDLDELKRVLNSGLEAAPDNRTLHYIRGVVNRAEGLFAAAASDLERAIGIDPEYAEGWNTLGLIRISLKEFDRAEEALERAKNLALGEAERYKTPPGEEYIAIIYNLAMFHEGLASHYNRENRITPTVESRRLMDRHAAGAKKYLREFLDREPSGSPDARSAQSKLDALP